MTDGELRVMHSWEVSSGGAVGKGLSVANVDDDPQSELFVGTNGGSIFAYDVQAEAAVEIATTATGRLAYGVSAADLNGDGKDEFILSRGMLNYVQMTNRDVVIEVYMLEQGKLKKAWSQETVNIPKNLVQDIDGDGKVEIIVYSPRPSEASSIEIYHPELAPE